MRARYGSSQPLHPDQYGHALARVLTMQPRESEVWDLPMPAMSATEMDAAWAQEHQFRTLMARVHAHHGCGHPCSDGACVVMAGLTDPLCIRCQVTEISDGERHRASKKKSA